MCGKGSCDGGVDQGATGQGAKGHLTAILLRRLLRGPGTSEFRAGSVSIGDYIRIVRGQFVEIVNSGRFRLMPPPRRSRSRSFSPQKTMILSRIRIRRKCASGRNACRVLFGATPLIDIRIEEGGIRHSNLELAVFTRSLFDSYTIRLICCGFVSAYRCLRRRSGRQPCGVDPYMSPQLIVRVSYHRVSRVAERTSLRIWTSSVVVDQLTNAARIAARLFHVVPLTKVLPSCCMASTARWLRSSIP